jgi:cytochrome c peroxidase
MKLRNKTYFIALAVGLFSTAISCKKPTDDSNGGGGTTGCQQVEMTPYTWVNPVRFPIADIPADNVMYVERINLGKKLFYDARLSNNGESCETCHKQSMGFSASDVSTFDKGLQKMPLVNLAWYKNFMWSGRIVGTLEDVMYAELTKRFSTDFTKINAIQEYKDLFCKYYGTDNITPELMAKPLAQFMRVLVSKKNKYDLYLLGEGKLTYNEEEGSKIFFSEKGDCMHCHVQLLTTDNAFHNNGLDSLYAKDIDKGRFNATGNPADLGVFRTPNLRNVALRTEFMHDGRFKTLEEVVNFYDHQVHIGVKNIDPVMVKPAKLNGGLHLTEIEKQQLIAFLKALTDEEFINNPEFKQ